MAILPLAFFSCRKDDKEVRPRGLDSGERGQGQGWSYKTEKVLKHCAENTNPRLPPSPGRRHQAGNELKKYDITVGFIICWIGILIINGVHFGATKKELRKLWDKPPYGVV